MRHLVALLIIASAIACNGQGIKERFEIYMNELKQGNIMKIKRPYAHVLNEKLSNSELKKYKIAEIFDITAQSVSNKSKENTFKPIEALVLNLYMSGKITDRDIDKIKKEYDFTKIEKPKK